MSAKSILQKIKQVFGLSPAGGADTEPPDDGGTEVTIEREPDQTDTAAGAEEAAGSGTAAAGSGAADAAGAPDSAEEASADSTAEAPVDTGEDPADSAEAAHDDSVSESAEETAETTDETADEAPDEPAPGDESTDAIKGIGPTYSDRLAEAGIETVADLANATPEAVADAAKTGESKAMSWIDRANDYLS